MPEHDSCAVKRMTASGEVSDAGKPVLIFGYGVECGGTLTYVYFNNAALTENKFIAGPITVSQGNIKTFSAPVMFPAGCYVSFDANTTAVSAFYKLYAVS